MTINEEFPEALFGRITVAHGYMHIRFTWGRRKVEGHRQSTDKFRGDYSDAHNGLRITCQMQASDKSLYGWQVEYADMYSIDLNLANKIAKVLKKVEKRMMTMSGTRGASEHYGEYVLRVAEALGIRDFALEPQGTNDGYRWTTDGREVRDYCRKAEAEFQATATAA